NVALQASPVAGLCMLAVLMAVMPWLIWKSHQFALFNSSYRGIRFGFDGSVKGAYFHYLALPLLCVLTLGLLYPFVHQRIKRFQHTQARYGSVPFSFDATVGAFYRRYLLLLGVGVALPAAVMAVLAGMVPQSNPLTRGLIVLFIVLVVYPYLLSAMAVFVALLQNLVWNHTQLGGHRFHSAMRARRIAFLFLTNMLAIVFTLGLYIPFATVRLLKYRLACMSLAVNGSLDDIAAGQRAEIGAVGDGAADLGGFDLGL
ncbi:MAG TPA: YjgN family protein, partial [Pseudoduganella sp.]